MPAFIVGKDFGLGPLLQRRNKARCCVKCVVTVARDIRLT